MSEWISLFLASLVLVLTQTITCSQILKTSINFRNRNNILKILILLVLTTVFYALTDSIIRVIMLFVCVAFINQSLFKKAISNCFIATLIFYLVLGFSEILVAIVLFMIMGSNADALFSNYFGNVMINTIICIIILLLVSIPKLLKKLQELANIELSDNKSFFITVSIAGVIMSSTSMYVVFFSVSSVDLLLIVMILIIIYTAILYNFFLEKKHKEMTENKNNVLIENISEYEKIIEIQKIESHENKNQLRIIKEMIDPNNEELIKYVEALILEKRKQDSNLLNRVKDIPNGGIRALIYAKLVNLNPDTKVNLIISKEIDSKVLNSIDSVTNVDICKILGVFLDNSIEEIQYVDKKILGIQLYCELDNLVIVISNTYGKEFNVNKVGEKNYSTKGANHGYGLQLVNKIIASNKNLKNVKQINGDIFNQILYVELQ